MVAGSCRHRYTVLVIFIAIYVSLTYGYDGATKTANYACPETGFNVDNNDTETVVLVHILNLDQQGSDNGGLVRCQILEIIKKGRFAGVVDSSFVTTAIQTRDFTLRCHVPHEGEAILYLVKGDDDDKFIITRIAMPTIKDCKYFSSFLRLGLSKS